MIKIPKELERLALLFKNNGHKLYIVGGYIRDSLLGIQSTIRDDIDLCSDVTPNKLTAILQNSEFKINPINESVGVMAIEGNRRYEHATFREEVYDNEFHNPSHVEFIKDLEKDASRRDFKINAIYYDILNKEIIDPLGGEYDLKEKIIETTKDPKYIFNDDPERILRLIRFACALGFDIPEKELKYAKKNAPKVTFISKYRLKNEFEKILTCDQIYPELPYTAEAHFRAMVLIGELDIWKFILPAVEEIKNSNVVDRKGELIYDHTLNCLKNASPNIRLAILLHDAAKVRTIKQQNNFFGAKEFVSVVVEKNLGIEGLGYKKEITNKITRIILGYDFDNYGFLGNSAIKQFIFKNKDVVEEVIEIKNVIKNENNFIIKPVRVAEKLRKNYNKMLKNNAPFNLADLDIKGNDIIEAIPNIKLENLDDLLDNLLMLAAISPKKNNKKDLIIMAHKLTKSKQDYYLEK